MSTQQETASLAMKGLPSWADAAYILSFIDESCLARGKDGRPQISILPVKDAHVNRCAKITFPDVELARYHINLWHGECPPRSKNKLNVSFWQQKMPKNGTAPKFDEDTTRRLRKASAVNSSSVFIKGLFDNCDESFLLSQVGPNKVAEDNNGRRRITVFPNHNTAKITFITVADAMGFIAKYHNKTFPHHGGRPLIVRSYWEREGSIRENRAAKPKTIVRNVLYVQGFSKKYTKEQLTEMVEKRTGKKISKATIFHFMDGRSQGRGSLKYADVADAQYCLALLNGKKLSNEDPPLKVNLFETTIIRRLEGAIENDHLFGSYSTGYTYECLSCCQTWDERDMIGCVPIGHHTEPETHFLCQTCVRSYCDAKNKLDGRLGNHGTGMPCFQPNCPRVLLWASVDRILTDRRTAARLDKRMTTEALSGVENIEYCKEGCGFGATLANFRVMQFFSCQNPACMAQFCRICHIPYTRHIGKTCDEVLDDEGA